MSYIMSYLKKILMLLLIVILSSMLLYQKSIYELGNIQKSLNQFLNQKQFSLLDNIY